MHNQYEQKALDFCKKWNVKIFFTHIGIVKSKEGLRNQYSFSIVRYNTTLQKIIKAQYTAVFTDSVIDSTRSKALPDERPTAYDLLSCIEKSEIGNMGEFLSEYGYSDSKESLILGMDLYPRVKAESEAIRAMFPEAEAMEDLYSIQ